MEATLLVRCWTVFDQVASLSPDVREGRVAELCGGDPALEAEVRALLKAGDSSAFATAPAQDALARSPLGSLTPAGTRSAATRTWGCWVGAPWGRCGGFATRI